MAMMRYPNPIEEIHMVGFIEEYCMFDMAGELELSLEDMERTKSENRELKENVKEVDECIKKLREKINNFREMHEEVNE